MADSGAGKGDGSGEKKRQAGSIWGKPAGDGVVKKPGEDPLSALDRVSSKPKPPVEVKKRSSGMTTQFRRSSDRLESPRRVRGGIASTSEAWPGEVGLWGRSIVKAIEVGASKAMVKEAFEDYAARGQTRRLSFGAGLIEGSVQGRRYKAYELRVVVPCWTEGEWDELTRSLVDEPALGSRVLAGDAPDELLAFIEGQGLELFPSDLGELSKQSDSKEPDGIDKHVICLLMLTAEAISRDPFVALEVRGLGREALIERMRQRKALDSSSSGAAAAYEPHPGEEGEFAGGSIDDDLEGFWEVGRELDEIELGVRKPEVSNGLLRRLGPSPFEEGKFPLVGVLATCYDIISERALEAEAERNADSLGGSPEDAEGGDGA